MASVDNDSGSDIDLSLDNYLNIRPYQYEPVVSQDAVETSDEEDETSEDDQTDINIERLANTHWCDCEQCVPMATGLESICCQEIQQIEYMCDEAEVKCITEHQYFIDNCLRREVVWVSLLEFNQYDGALDDNEPINEAYRYCAYRRFARLVYHRLPKKCRKVHPSCVVRKIREAFPAESGSYTGFKYARPCDHGLRTSK